MKSNRSDQNRRHHAKLQEQRKRGIFPTVPRMPDDIARAEELTEEQTRTADMVLEAATWAIHARRQMREDARKPVMTREYVTTETRGFTTVRCV